MPGHSCDYGDGGSDTALIGLINCEWLLSLGPHDGKGGPTA